MRELSKTDRVEPKRTKLLRDSEAPKFVISMTDKENREPNRATPNTDKVAPRRTTLRTDMEEPTLQ
jgi:hypothetical protein